MKTNRRPQRTFSVLVVLLVIGASIALAACQPAAAPSATALATATEVAPMDASPALGPQDAPVSIVMYGDFGCSTCWYWYKLGVLKQLRAKYGDKIHFIWRDFPVITILSPKAAEAGQCANEQGKFWEFHDSIYEHQGVIAASDLKAYAVEVGLDMAQFQECVSSRRYQNRVNAEQHEAFERGLKGTPAFFVNDQPLIGPQALAAFEALIDPILAGK
jgi:protein-disulfide isomerase